MILICNYYASLIEKTFFQTMALATVSASHDQSHQRRYGSAAWVQCTGIAVAAIAFSGHQHPVSWTSSSMDTILAMGTWLYREGRRRQSPADLARSNYLAVDDVPMQFQYGTQRYSLAVESLLERGFRQGQHEGSIQHLEFRRLLGETLTLADAAVVISCGLSVAVFKIAPNLLGLFGSHSRDRFGRLATHRGKARLTFHRSIEQLSGTICSHYGVNNNWFSMTPLIHNRPATYAQAVRSPGRHRILLPQSSPLGTSLHEPAGVCIRVGGGPVTR